MSVLLASAPRTSSGTSAVSSPSRLFVAAAIILNVTAAATDAGDTLNVYVQHSPDGTNYDDFVSFTQVLGNGGAKKYIAQWSALATPETEMRAPADGSLAAGSVLQGPVSGLWRVKWTIVDGGTVNASFTFSVNASLVALG